jgi:nicotinamide mononucleotide (NMN) deamidase PncC
MTGSIEHLVETIHASPELAVIALAGAGGQALAWLLGVPGASKTVLEAIVPYGRRAMIEFLGREPAQYVSPETARDMAESAYRRALLLREGREPVVGLACTATLATDRPKRGDHRCCVAARDDVGVTTYSLVLAKGRRDRSGEEDVASRLFLRVLAESCGLEPDLPLGLLDGEHLEVHYTRHTDPLEHLERFFAPGRGEAFEQRFHILTVYPDGRMAADEPLTGAVLPGSFNPLHEGHERLARVASETLGAEVAFEISVVNVDKPPLEEPEVRRRLSQFRGRWPVVLTRAPTFREKAALLPGCVFVIGWDTAVRLVHPRYYGGREEAMHAALAEIRSKGCRFLVAGRLHEGVFHTLADIAMPADFEDLFEGISASRFRYDISSTEVRSARPED